MFVHVMSMHSSHLFTMKVLIFFCFLYVSGAALLEFICYAIVHFKFLVHKALCRAIVNECFASVLLQADLVVS
jgi:hypothetical protein